MVLYVQQNKTIMGLRGDHINQAMIKGMEALGYQMKIVGIEHLEDMRRDLENSYQLGQIDENLYQWLKYEYQFEVPTTERTFKSILIIASQSTLTQVSFCWRDKNYTLILPPTYLEFITEPLKIKESLEHICQDEEIFFVQANHLPNKPLAVNSGLGRYGRNNLCYVPGFGSYLLLSSFFSNLTVQEDDWCTKDMMSACNNCSVCVKQCPTQALSQDRFTIRAEKCITYHNEFWGKPNFPEWIVRDAHTCLVGCLECQRLCPENKGKLIVNKKGTFFNDEETQVILENTPADQLNDELADKLHKVNLMVHYNYLARNLKVLLK